MTAQVLSLSGKWSCHQLQHSLKTDETDDKHIPEGQVSSNCALFIAIIKTANSGKWLFMRLLMVKAILALWKDCSGLHTPLISSGLHLSSAELCPFKETCRLWKGAWIRQALEKLLARRHEHCGAGWSGTSVQSIAGPGEAWQSPCFLHFFLCIWFKLFFFFLFHLFFFFFFGLYLCIFFIFACLSDACRQSLRGWVHQKEVWPIISLLRDFLLQLGTWTPLVRTSWGHYVLFLGWCSWMQWSWMNTTPLLTHAVLSLLKWCVPLCPCGC